LSKKEASLYLVGTVLPWAYPCSHGSSFKKLNGFKDRLAFIRILSVNPL